MRGSMSANDPKRTLNVGVDRTQNTVLTCPVRRKSLQKSEFVEVQRHQYRMGGKLWRRQDALPARRHALPARRGVRWHALLARRDARRHALPARRHALPARRGVRWHALPARRDARWHALPARRRERKRRPHCQLLADQAKNPGLTRRGFFFRPPRPNSRARQ
jgi:hypothetical protein